MSSTMTDGPTTSNSINPATGKPWQMENRAPNMQNLPKDGNDQTFRALTGMSSEEADEFLKKVKTGEVQFDTAQLEMRIAAAFNEGEIDLKKMGLVSERLEKFEAAAGEFVASGGVVEEEGVGLTAPKLADAAAILEQRCMAVEVEVSTLGYSTSRKVTDGSIAASIQNAHASMDAVSVSKRLFDSKHEAVKRFNGARRAIDAYRDSKTIPMARMPVNSIAEQASTAEEAADRVLDVLSKKPGTRVILKQDIEEFETTMATLRADLQYAAQAMNDQMEDIIANDRKRLGDLFDERDYGKQQIAADVTWGYTEIGLDVDFEKVAPTAAARMRSQIERQMVDTAALAIQDYADDLQKTVETVARQLGRRTRLKPADVTGRFYCYTDAELLETYTHEDDPEIPEGMMKLQVRYTPDGKSKAVVDTTPTFKAADYEAIFCPYETDERRKVSTSTIERMVDRLSEFHTVAQMLGPAGEPLAKAVKNAQSMVQREGGSSARFLSSVKNSEHFRSTAAETLGSVGAQLKEVVSFVDDSSNLRFGARKVRLKRRNNQEK